MAHFAQIDENDIVIRVIVIDQDTLNTGLWGDPSTWVQTSYNTRGGVHYGEDGKPDGGSPLRKNYAGVGYVYDRTHDAFRPPQPFPSWTLDMDSFLWVPPVPMPLDGNPHIWHEDTKTWVLISE